MSDGKSDPSRIVSYDTNANPAPREEGASPDDARVSWIDITVAVESEFERAVMWRRVLREQLETEPQTDREKETLRGAIAQHARRAAVFAALVRMVDRARGDAVILGRLRAIDAEERRTAGEAGDTGIDE